MADHKVRDANDTCQIHTFYTDANGTEHHTISIDATACDKDNLRILKK